MSKAVDQTDKDAEYYRAMVVSQGDTIELLKHNIREMQEQIYTLYKRIDELNNGNMERQTSDRD